MLHGKNRIPHRIDRRLSGLAGPEYHAIISIGLPIKPEDSQYGKSWLISLRRDVRSDIFGAYGIPIGLSAAGAAVRESWRQFLAGTVSPLSKIVTAELADKLDAPNLTLTFEDLRAADIVGRARSYKQLVEADMDAAKAAAITGLD